MPSFRAKRKRSLSRTARRRRKFSRRLRRSRIIRTPMYHKFKRTVPLLDTTYSSSTLNFAGYSYSFRDMQDYAEFESLFDSYKLYMIVLRVYCGATSLEADSGATNMGWVHYCEDFTDANPPASLNEMREYASYKCKPMQRCQPWKIVLKPRLEASFYRTAITTGYGSMRPLFIDTGATGGVVPHYGSKWCFEAGNPAQAKTVRIVGQYYFICRNVK